MLGDGRPGLAVEDVVEAGLGAAFVAQPLEEEQRIDDPPPGVGVDIEESFVFGRHLVGRAVPLEEPFVEEIGFLQERDLDFEARGHDRVAHRSAELGNDDLFGLVDDVERATRDENQNQEGDEDDEEGDLFHWPPPAALRSRRGSTPERLSSRMSFRSRPG